MSYGRLGDGMRTAAPLMHPRQQRPIEDRRFSPENRSRNEGPLALEEALSPDVDAVQRRISRWVRRMRARIHSQGSLLHFEECGDQEGPPFVRALARKHSAGGQLGTHGASHGNGPSTLCARAPPRSSGSGACHRRCGYSLRRNARLPGTHPA